MHQTRQSQAADRRTPTLHCGRERQQRDVARALDGHRQSALVWRARAGQPARQDLPALGDELAHQLDVLVVDDVDFFLTKLANLPAAKVLPAGAGAFPARGAFPFAAAASLDCHLGSLL